VLAPPRRCNRIVAHRPQAGAELLESAQHRFVQQAVRRGRSRLRFRRARALPHQERCRDV